MKLPRLAGSLRLTMEGTSVQIKTADGACPAWVFRPSGHNPLPGVVFYMDAIAMRPALHQMASMLAECGYCVLLPDLFYRFGPYGPFEGKTAFTEEKSRDQIRAMMTGTTQAMTRSDTEVFLKCLEDHNVTGKFGAVGYCMGGGRALTAAGAYPENIAAAASFHGAGLASDSPDSPHLLAPQMKARVYVGVAGIDAHFTPEEEGRLAIALRAADVDHIIETYSGAKHGWAVPDHSVYDETASKRHWKKLLEFFDETLEGE